jgi:ABC-type uncharacterized transport system involved in gliding motility auxiliary subunit
MRRLPMILGLVALLSLALGLNVLALKQNPFLVSVLVPLGVGVLTGLIWVALSLAQVARQSAAERRTLYGLNTVVTSVLFLGICIVVYAFAQHGKWSWDLTQEGRRKLSEQTVQVLKTLNKDVNVFCFFLKVDDELVRIALDKTTRFLEQCQQYTPHLKVEFLDPQVDRVRLEGLNITHASTQGTVVLRCGNRQKVIMLSGGSPRLEERDFTNGLVNVVRDAQPKVYFLTGHGERSIADKDEQNGGTLLKTLLESEAYKVDRAAIMITHPELPPDCDVLVINGLGIAGPQSDLHPEEVRAIQAFLDRGGRMLLLVDPWRRITTGENQTDQLLPWLAQRYGIVVGSDMAVSPTSRWTVEFSADRSLFNDKNPMSEYMGCFDQSHRITENFDQQILFSAARTVGLAEKLPDRVVGTVLLRTTPDFYAETDLATLTTQGKAVKSPEEKAGPLPMAIAVTAKTDFLIGDTGQTRDARIVVVGDSDFASNGQVAAIKGNLNLILNIMAWLTENEELIAIRPTGKQDAPVILSDFDQRVIVWVAVLGTVQGVALIGLIVYRMRRKYQ